MKVQSWYTKSFKDLRSFPVVKDAADDERFTELLQVRFFAANAQNPEHLAAEYPSWMKSGVQLPWTPISISMLQVICYDRVQQDGDHLSADCSCSFLGIGSGFSVIEPVCSQAERAAQRQQQPNHYCGGHA